MTYGDQTSHNDHHVCELFSDYIGLVCDKDTVDGLDSYLDSITISGDALANIIVFRDEVLKKIKQLDKNKGPGPEDIPAFFVQRCTSLNTCDPYIERELTRDFGEGLPERDCVQVYKTEDADADRSRRCGAYRWERGINRASSLLLVADHVITSLRTSACACYYIRQRICSRAVF
ncbi:hypothetical protein EVAR_62711_1 [Eumeta japonica]|uniref:Uncharacterized protein n=1 Tax=Eumeta variegata TaxID=151549 RepID=A0A4C1Z1H2_EUMVA|nr:hypothetical protein EVAR_62711_1 [Eumeta japonica]